MPIYVALTRLPLAARTQEDTVRQRTATFVAIMYVRAFAATAALGQTADLVAVNGRVFTARVGAPLTQSFAVKDGRFIAVGSSAAIRARIGPDTKIIDLGGRFVVPGLADGHFHNEGGGPGIDLSATRSIADLLAAVGAAAAETIPGDVVAILIGTKPSCEKNGCRSRPSSIASLGTIRWR